MYDELKRRRYIGLRCNNITYCDDSAFYVGHVVESSPADMVGLKNGDVIIRINGMGIDSSATIQSYSSEKALNITLLRQEKIIECKLIPTELPKEDGDLYTTVTYSHLLCGKYKLRTIITTPRLTESKDSYPVIVLFQGIECQTIDMPFSYNNTYKRICYHYSKLGYATVRIDRYGCGDSEGDHCSNLDFLHEIRLYLSLINALPNYDKFDTKRIVLFGYSLGGVIAPIVATQTDLEISDIIVFGTITTRFSKYLIDNAYRQCQRNEMSSVHINQYMTALKDLADDLLIKQMEPKQIVQQNPALKDFFDGDLIFGRNYKFFQQWEAIRIKKIWHKVKSGVTIVAGKYDYLIDFDKHKSLYNYLIKHNKYQIHFMPSDINHNFINYLDGHFSYETIDKINNCFDTQ